MATTTAEIRTAIVHLRQLLQREYGRDFSYIVCGQGKVLGASTKNSGEIPTSELDKGEYKIDK